MLVCGVILVGGFFYAARLHFSAMDYGFKNAKLREQKAELEAEQRRFKLAREIALSPAEIKKAARKLGFQDMSASNIQLLTRTEKSPNNSVEKTSYVKPKNASANAPENPVAEKTKEGKTADKSKPADKSKSAEKTKTADKNEKRPEAAKNQSKLNKHGEAGR
jgi:hypothetical protein